MLELNTIEPVKFGQIVKYLRNYIRATSLLGVVLGLANVARAEGTPVNDWRAFAPSPAKLVWIRQVDGNGDDPFCWQRRHILMAADMGENRGERALLSRVGNYHRPMISPDGSYVVFSQYSSRRFFRVNWNGSGLQPLGDGYALDIWRDPVTGRDYVYYTTTGNDAWDKHHGDVIHRMPVDDTSASERIWSGGKITIDNVQFSADGKRFCAQFPHPRAGIGDVITQRWTPISRGCWTSMAPDNSYWTWVFDGKHRNVTIFDTMNDTGWMVDIHQAPGIDGYEIYHPRWSNHRSFMVMTGPYTAGSKGQNLISAGGAGVEIYAGRFDDDFRRVASWFKATENQFGDFYPDLWMADGETDATKINPTKSNKPQADDWPLFRDGLAFVWDNAGQPDVIDGAAGQTFNHGPIESHGKAIWGPHEQMWLMGGWFSSGPIAGVDGDISVECVIRPAAEQHVDEAVIMGLYANQLSPYWQLVQRNDQLFLKSTSNDVLLMDLIKERDHHVVANVSASGGTLSAWHDGGLIAQSNWVADGPTPTTNQQRLIVGGTPNNHPAWRGMLEGLAIYRRTLDPDEIRLHANLQAARLTNRKSIPSFDVTARLLHAPPPPDPASIAPYRRALSGHRYALESVEHGEFPHDEFIVATWTVLDVQIVPRDEKIGRLIRMRLEPFESHPQLESERMMIDPSDSLNPIFIAIDESSINRHADERNAK